MTKLEEVMADASTADGYVVVFNHDKSYDVVLAVPQSSPHMKYLARLKRAFTTHKLYEQVRGFRVDPRKLKGKTLVRGTEIIFAIPKGNEEIIRLFLEFARQSTVLTNPIVSDMRNFDLK